MTTVLILLDVASIALSLVAIVLVLKNMKKKK